MFIFVILQDSKTAATDYAGALKYAGYVPSPVIRLSTALKYQHTDRARDEMITDWKESEKTRVINMFRHEQKGYDESQRKIGIRQLSIICARSVDMNIQRWTAADLSWSCLKSENASIMQPVQHVAAASTLVQDAVLTFVQTDVTSLQDIVSMDSLTLANNSASQKAGYVPGIHCS